MRIGDLSEVAGVPAQTIRFYERRGLLPEPVRTPNGYRAYDDSVLARLAFIRSGQAAGLTLLELRGILDQRRECAVPCAHVSPCSWLSWTTCGTVNASSPRWRTNWRA